ncbi:MAG: hypothetical protein VW881_08640, partial [Alphaproteobacteria bacterium]
RSGGATTSPKRWAATTDCPKLFIEADPGQIILEADRKVFATWPNHSKITVRGLHHPQEDSPDDIGKALAGWYGAL